MRSLTLMTSIVCYLLLSTTMASANDPIRAEFTTSDGVAIIADFWTPQDIREKAPVVILLHMNQYTRHSWKPLIPTLKEAGFAIMAIDLRGHGESISPASKNLQDKVKQRDEKLYNAMHRDVAAAYTWLAERPEVDLSRLALVGASVGCSVALDYAARDKSVDVTVLMTPGKNYLGVDSAMHIKRYGQRPILMLTSEEERSKGADFLSTLAASANVSIFPQTDIHGTKMFGKVQGIEKKIADYLSTHVGQPSNEMVYASINSNVYHPVGSSMIQRINKENLRVFSSAAEATRRGLRAAKTGGKKPVPTDEPSETDTKKTDDPDDF